MALGAILLSASCAKEDPAKAVDFSAPEKQATIQGKLLVNSDVSQQSYAGLSGVTVIATVPYSSLNSSVQNAGSFSASTETNSDGDFTLQVPATAAGVTVTLTVSETQSKQKLPTGDVDGIWSFSIPNQTNVKPGQTLIIPAITGSFEASVPEKATIQGRLLVNANVALPSDNQTYSALSGIIVTATGQSGAEDFSVSGATNASGDFILKVPAPASYVTLTVADKEGTQTQVMGYNNGTPITGAVSGSWSFTINVTPSVVTGQTVKLGSFVGTFAKDDSKKVGDPVNAGS